MTEGEKRINILIVNVAQGAYDLAYLKDILARGLEHVEAYGVKNVDKQFILNLAHIEAAIQRIERAQKKNPA
jgi:hypothetical protein